MCEYYDQESVWSEEIDELNVERIKTILNVIPEKVSSILEIGCGDGRIINQINNKQIVIGLDTSRLPLTNVIGDSFLGQSGSIPMKESSLDLVLASEILEHLTDEQLAKTCSEMERVARSYILVTVPYKEKPYMTFVKCNNCGFAFSPYGHKQYFDEKRLKTIFPDASIEIKYIGTKIHAPIYEKIGQKFLKSYKDFKRPVTCPKCKKISKEYKMVDNRIHDIYRGFAFDKMKHFFRILPNWILILYNLNHK